MAAALRGVLQDLQWVQHHRRLFAFDAPVWQHLGFACRELRHVWRQTDRRFASLLAQATVHSRSEL